MGKDKEILTLTGRRIIPALYDAQFLLDNELIQSKDVIDNSVYQVSNFATNIELKDDNNTTIRVRPDQIGILGNTKYILNFYNVLKKAKDKIEIVGINYFILYHFEESDIFKRTIDKISDFEFLNIDSIEFSRKNYFVKLRECAEDKLHIDLSKELMFEQPTPLNEIPVNIEKEIEATHNFANSLFNEHFNLNL